MKFHRLSESLHTLAIAMFLAAPVAATPERPAPDLLFIDNDAVRIGIDRSMGASISWLSWRAHPQNIINIHDPGRLLQQSYYAGKKLDRRTDGQHEAWSPWTWNPIQGGGVMSWARVTRFEKSPDGRLIAETVPKLWDMPDEEAEAVMEQFTQFEPDMPNAVQVRNRFISKRRENDRWGGAVPRAQELPACYFTSAFHQIESYLGHGKWRREEQAPGPPWGTTTPPLNVMACFNDDGQGVAVFSPVADKYWNFGPHRPYTPAAKPEDGPCVHIAPLSIIALDAKSTLEYRYWLVVGSKEEITKAIDTLLGKYRSEKIILEK
jgi:hypothetical protein